MSIMRRSQGPGGQSCKSGVIQLARYGYLVGAWGELNFEGTLAYSIAPPPLSDNATRVSWIYRMFIFLPV